MDRGAGAAMPRFDAARKIRSGELKRAAFARNLAFCCSIAFVLMAVLLMFAFNFKSDTLTATIPNRRTARTAIQSRPLEMPSTIGVSGILQALRPISPRPCRPRRGSAIAPLFRVEAARAVALALLRVLAATAATIYSTSNFLAALSRAALARLFSAISSAPGTKGFRVNFSASGFLPHPQTGRSGGHMHPRALSAMNCLTIRSSSE